jgi:hypothetical protein
MRKLEQAVWIGWRHRAEEEKRAARKTDADLAAEVSELVGYDIGRALVNHWFRGRREPSLVEFIALCTALGADPGHILLNVRVAFQRVPETSQMSSALRDRGVSPTYLTKSAKRLKRSKARKPKVLV